MDDGTPLYYAVRYGLLDIVKFLVQWGLWQTKNNTIDSTNTQNQTLLHCAAREGNFEIVEFLVESEADKESKDSNDETPLHHAARQNHLEIVKFLVASGANTKAKNKKDQIPLNLAITKRNVTIENYLNLRKKNGLSTDHPGLNTFYFLQLGLVRLS